MYRGISIFSNVQRSIMSVAFLAIILFVPLEYMIDTPINGAVALGEFIARIFHVITNQGTQFIAILARLPLVAIDAIGSWIVTNINIHIIGNLNNLLPPSGKIQNWVWDSKTEDFSLPDPFDSNISFQRVNIVKHGNSLFMMLLEAMGL